MMKPLSHQISIQTASVVITAALVIALLLQAASDNVAAVRFYPITFAALILGAVVYFLNFFQLRKRVDRPLREIESHAEDLALGIFQKWDYPGYRSGFDRVSESINCLADYNGEIQEFWKTSSLAVANHFVRIREVGGLPSEVLAELDAAWVHLRNVDASIMRGLRPSPQFSRPPDIALTDPCPLVVDAGHRVEPWRHDRRNGKSTNAYKHTAVMQHRKEMTS